MAENNRLTRINGVVKAYNTIMNASRGEVSCTVTTAKVWDILMFYIQWSIYIKPLNDKDLKELKTTLQQFLDKKETLNLTLKVSFGWS